MYSLRKWFYRPKKEDTSKLAMFYWADEELTMVATELDSFDGRNDPERCSILVTQLRLCQDKVLSICNEIMDEAIPDMRANRDFRAKFPDDVLHESLAGQLWFGAECLAAGSNIINRELESASMRPLAKALTRALDNVRCYLRAQTLKNSQDYSDKVREALRIFDRLFAEFELAYVSAMVPIKSAKEYHLQQEIIVLFSETLIRGLKLGLIEQEMVDDYDPSLMFTIPRLAIVWGLLIFPDGPLNVSRDPDNMSELFRPFCSLLMKIRDLLWTLTRNELGALEKMLCSQEEPKMDKTDNRDVDGEDPFHSTEDYINKFCKNHDSCKQFVQDFYFYNFGSHIDESGNREAVNENNLSSSLKENIKSSDLRVKNVHNQKSHSPLPDSVGSDANNIPSSELERCNNNSLSASLTSAAQNASYDFQSQGLPEKSSESNCVQYCHCENKSLTHNKVSSTCSFCSGVLESLGQSSPSGSVSLECCLSQVNSQCSYHFSMDCSPQRQSPSRALIQQVMSHVEIVPPGHHMNGYSSSPEGSPRAYHRGLLCHSFPSHPVFTDTCASEADPVSAATSLKQKRYRLPSRRSNSFKMDCGVSPPRLRYGRALMMYKNVNSVSNSSPLSIPVRAIEDTNFSVTNSSCSSCQSITSVSSQELNSTSPETSSYNSECQDDEEIALALQAAEIASRNKARARFKSSKDLLHKLFVCISGVADQLQTNYASDLRNILKSVFDMNCSLSQKNDCDGSSASDNSSHCEEITERTVVCGENEHTEANETDLGEGSSPSEENVAPVELVSESVHICEPSVDYEKDGSSVDSAEEALPDSPTSLIFTDIADDNDCPRSDYEIGPPAWVPDDMSSHCMDCEVSFTLLRRRHHCRNCGKIFCSRCSSNSIPLPQYGHLKPVRVCNQCFMYQLTSLVIQHQQS